MSIVLQPPNTKILVVLLHTTDLFGKKTGLDKGHMTKDKCSMNKYSQHFPNKCSGQFSLLTNWVVIKLAKKILFSTSLFHLIKC